MSREVLGDAPVLKAIGDDAPAPRPSSVATRSVEPVRSVRRSTAAVLYVVLVLATAAGGWFWYDARSAGSVEIAHGTVAGVFSGYSVGGDGATPPRARLAVVVINSGRDDVVITAGTEDGSRTGSFNLQPTSATVRAGATVPFDAEVLLDCSRSPALDLPPLRMDVVGGEQRDLPIIGVSGTVFRLCSEGALDLRPVRMTSERIERGRLILDLATPAGQPVRVDVVRAGSIPVSIGGQPVTLQRNGTQLILHPPARCQDAWRTTAIPTYLILDISAGPDPTYPSSIRMPSTLLATWLLSGACGAPDA